MRESAETDAELLADWLRHRREASFRQLVSRYAGLVHSAARRTCGNDALAAEASQLVFILLANKAASLTSRTSLAGWLHLTAVMQVRNLMRRNRRETRKRQHLQSAMDTHASHSSDDVWKEMQPVLDEALASLSEKDREALLLRFYRSLSVREIAATLGIATDAAQKRIDRATARLRDKLARRGCHAGGVSLAAAMLAGFATDAQAASPSVPLLTSKALAGSGGALATHTILSSVLVMKTAPYVVPVILLLIAGLWIGPQWEMTRELDRQSSLLSAAITGRSSFADASPGASSASVMANPMPFGGKGPIDWMLVAGKMEDADFSDMERLTVDERMSKMTQEELLAAMDEIASLSLPANIRERLEEMIVYPMSRKFPAFAVTRLTDRKPGGASADYLVLAMENWTRQDPAEAIAWMDRQVEAGAFELKTLDGQNRTRLGYESAVLHALLAKDESLVSMRFDRLPAEVHKDVLLSLHEIWKFGGAFEPGAEEVFCKLVRSRLSERDQAELLARRAVSHSAGGMEAVDEFLDRIGATPAETVLCVGQTVTSRLESISINRAVLRGDIDALREWAARHVPLDCDRLTGEALGSAAGSRGIAGTNYRTMGYAAAAAFAVEYSVADGNDRVLAAFLKSEGGGSNKNAARDLARKISNENLRAEILRTLK